MLKEKQQKKFYLKKKILSIKCRFWLKMDQCALREGDSLDSPPKFLQGPSKSIPPSESGACPSMTNKEQKGTKMDQKRLKRTKMDQEGPRWTKRDQQKGPGGTKSHQKSPKDTKRHQEATKAAKRQEKVPK